MSACDDSCADVLVWDRQLQKGTGHLFGGFIPPPWPQLQATNNAATEPKNPLHLGERVSNATR